MFLVLMRFASNRSQAGQLMQGHQEWIRRGFDDGVFALVGSIEPEAGGALVAHSISLPQLQDRVDADPFVVEGVVSAEILEITPSLTDTRLAFLLAGGPARPAASP